MLTESQKRQLCKCSVAALLYHIKSGIVNFPEDFIYVETNKVQQIKESLNAFLIKQYDLELETRFKEIASELFKDIKDKCFSCDGIPCYIMGMHTIRISNTYCPKCGYRMLDITVSSPAEYWENLCGRQGNLSICSHCSEQGDFELLIMS